MAYRSVSPNRASAGPAPRPHTQAKGSHHEHGSACCSHGHDSAPPVATSPLTVPPGSTLSRLRINQLDCPTEEALIRKKLNLMTQVDALEFNLIQRTLTVVHRAGTLGEIRQAIASLGMQAEPLAAQQSAVREEAPESSWRPLLFGMLAALGAELTDWLASPAWAVAALALLAVALCGLTTYRKGWIALKHRDLNINALMSLAVTGAALLGQWPEAAMVMVLFTLAERIEGRSLGRARHAIRRLLELAPARATVQQADGSWRECDAQTVAAGQTVRVGPGERLAVDGIVISGSSALDQAPITGESLPVEKAAGDPVYAGSINTTGAIVYRASSDAGHSTLARIIRAVEQAQSSRAPIQRFVDRFARVYTPAVCLIALLVAVVPPLLLHGAWHDWVYKALVLLVIACPCALVISTPVTLVSGLTAAARHGILIKGGAVLETGRRLAWLAFDKTGTITRGKPQLLEFQPLDAEPGQDVLQLAASLAAQSSHPVSHAIATAGQQKDVTLLPVSGFFALPGRGVRGTIDGVEYQLGNHRLIHELGVCSPALEARLGTLEAQGKSVILLSDGVRVAALFVIADAVKPGSVAAVRQLHALGLKTVMLSGDNPHTVRTIAAEVGIETAWGDQLPEDKLAKIGQLSAQGVVGMVGDGINDAPALARADIGFAMGAAGSDAAIETADVALMDDDPGKLAAFVRLSRATYAILVQNIGLALGIKAVFLVLTLLGHGTMWMAVFADMGASLLVVGNGLRLLRSGRMGAGKTAAL